MPAKNFNYFVLKIFRTYSHSLAYIKSHYYNYRLEGLSSYSEMSYTGSWFQAIVMVMTQSFFKDCLRPINCLYKQIR